MAAEERREPLSRERVLRAALALADREGLGALSMRALARALDVEAMSLYHHVERKDDLLAGIAALVMEEVALPDAPATEWKDAVRRGATSYHAALRRHPWVHEVRAAPSRTDTGTARYMEWLLGTLRRGGFSARLTHHAYHILDSHVVGSALWEAGVVAVLADRPLADLARDFLSRMPPAEFPYVHEHTLQHVGGATKGDRHPFELGLDLILDGLEGLRDEAPAPPRGARRTTPRTTARAGSRPRRRAARR